MKKLIILLIFIASASLSTAQRGCYESIRKEGLDSLKKNKYLSAMEKFELAYDCYDCPVNNDLRERQEECRKGIEVLIEELNSNKDKEISDLLLDLGKNELEQGNYHKAVYFFYKTYNLSSTLNDSVRIISSNLYKSWQPSLTMSLPDMDLSGNTSSGNDLYAPGSELYDAVAFESGQVFEVIYPDTVTLWNDYSVDHDALKIGFHDEIEQLYPDKKGEYLAVSFTKDPRVSIYSLTDKAIIASFKPKKVNVKYKEATRRNRKDLKSYDKELYQYNQDIYQYEKNAYQEKYYADPLDNPPFLVVRDKLFYLYQDSLTIESFNIRTNKRRQIKLNDFKVHQMVSSPDENYIVMYGEKDVLLFDVLSNTSYPVQSSGILAGSCRFTSDSKKFAVATSNNLIDLFVIEDGYPVFFSSNLFQGAIRDFNFNQAGDKIVTLLNLNQDEQVIRVYSLPYWNDISGNIKITYSGITNVGMVNDFVYGISGTTCSVWKLPLVFVQDGEKIDDSGIALNHPGFNYFPADLTLQAVRSLETVVNKARGEGLAVYRAGLSPGFDYVAISTLGSDFYIYNANNSQLIRKYPVNSLVRDFCFTGVDKMAVLCEDAKILILDLQKAEPEKVFEHEGKTIRDIQPSNTGDYLSVTLADGDVIIYSISSLAEYFRIKPQMYPDSSLVMPSRGWFSPGDNYFAMTTTEGKLMNLDLTDRTWTGNSDQDIYSYIGSLSWVSDSVYLAGSQYYGYIERISTKTGTDSTFYIFTVNVPAEIISIPGKNIVIAASEDGTLSLYDDMKGLRLGLPFIFKSLPEVISYDTVSGECMVYVKGDGFYRVQPFLSRSAEKIKVDLTGTGLPVSHPNMLGEWSFIFKDINGVKYEYAISLEAEIDSVYYGNYLWWYYNNIDDTTDIQWAQEPIACTYDPYSRKLKMEFTGETGGMDTYHCKAYVSEDGKSLHFGTMESYDSPGVEILQWSGRKKEDTEDIRSH